MAEVQHGCRQVHLDFHTSPLIPGVGSKFDAKTFIKTVKAAHVDSVTVFAKCHHGHVYFDAEHPARHPTMPKGMDLLKAEIDALHGAGVRAPIYISVLWDEFAANTHPEWLALSADGSPVGAGPLQPGWRVLDLASPYFDYLRQQTAEVLRRFHPVDGIFFDICFDVPSVSRWAKARMSEWELDPASEADRAEYAARLSQFCMEKLFRQVKSACADATVYFNSRPFHRLPEDIQYLTHVEIESLPSSAWGYWYFPINVRYARTFGRPYLGMTARFHKGWADFGGLKPYAALKYEVCQMLAHGARCSVGDQMHPQGIVDEAAWELIGSVYEHAEACQPWCEDATPLAQIGVFRQPSSQPVGRPEQQSDVGATRMLTELKHQFDVVSVDSHWRPYKLLILPDSIPIDSALARRLSAYVKNGGRLLATGDSGLGADLKPVLPGLPVSKVQPSPYTTTYIRFDRKSFPNVPQSDYANYSPTLRATPKKGTIVPARVVEPYFERSYKHFSSHAQTPPEKLARWPAAVLGGPVGYIPFPVFSAYAEHAALPYRYLVQGCIEQLVGRALVEIDLPSYAECTLMSKGDSTVLHVIAFCPQRRTKTLDLVEDEVPLYDVEASVALKKRPARVFLAPSGEEVEFSYSAGRAELVIPEIVGHQMVVFE